MPHAVEPVAAAAADFVVIVAAMWVLGSAAASRWPSAERLAVGFLLVVGAGVVVMAQPLVRASLLGHPIAVRLAALAIVGGALVYRRPGPVGRLRPATLVAAIAVAAAVAYPAWRVPTDRLTGSDMQWHEGWIRQLTGGATSPTGLYADVPNAYPWLYHAIAAGVMQAFAAGMATTLLVVEALLLLGLGLGTWVCARELGLCERAASWAVVLAVGGGGIGWLWSHGPAAVLTVGGGSAKSVPPGLAAFRHGVGAYGGDLLLSPGPTPALSAVPPAEPRDLGLALVPLALWLVLRARARRSRAIAAGAGASIGLVFLLSPVAADVTAVCAIVIMLRGAARLLIPVAAGAAAVCAVWVAPLAWHYHQLGGFINTTRATPKSPDVFQVAVTLAVLLALAGVGAVSLSIRRGNVDLVALAMIVGIPFAIYALSLIGLGSGGAVPAFGRSVRYLPLFALALALPAGVGAAAAVRSVRRGAPYVAVAVGALCVASPVAAAVGMSRAQAWADHNPVAVCDSRSPLGARDVVAIVPVRHESNNVAEAVALSVFALTGSHQYYVPRPRIRYGGIFEHIPPQEERLQAAKAVRHGAAPPAGVTAVLAPAGEQVTGPGVAPAGSCRIHAFGAGRFYDARYVLYRVRR